MTLHGRRSRYKKDKGVLPSIPQRLSLNTFLCTRYFQLMPFLTYIQLQDMPPDEYSKCLNYSSMDDIMT